MPTDQELMAELFKARTGNEPIRADRSAVQRYATCPYQAWAIREQKIEEHSTLLDVGQALHTLAEEQIKDAIAGHLQPNELADEIVNALPSVRPDIQPRVIKAARYLAHELCEIRLHDVIGVEMQIDDACKTRLTTLRGRPYILTACLDLLVSGQNKSLHVFDWKSGFKKRSKQDVETDFQARFDCNILFKMYDGSNGTDRIERVHWWFVETFWGRKAYFCFERDAEYPSLPHLSLEKQIEGQIFEAIKLWANDSRQAWPEPKRCTWCPAEVVKQCPHCVPEALDIVNNPQKFIDRMIVLNTAYKNMYETAKNWYSANGPIYGSSTVFEWRKPKQKFTPKIYKKNGQEDEINENDSADTE